MNRQLATPAATEVVRGRYVAALGKLVRGDFVRQSAVVFAASMTSNVFNYAFQFLVSRILGVAQYGELSSLLAATMIASVPSTVLSMVVVKYAAELHALGERGKIRRLAEQTALVALCGGGTLFLLAVSLRVPIAVYLKIGDPGLVSITALYLALSLVNAGTRSLLQGTHAFAAFGTTLCVESLGKCAIGAGLAAAGFGVRGALIGFLASSILGITVSTVAMWRTLHAPRERIRLDYRRLVTTSSGVAGATLVLMTLSYADVVLVKHYFDAASAGTYSALSLAGKILLFLIGFVPMIVLPRASALVRAKRLPLRLLREAFTVSIVVSVACLVGFGAFSHLVIRVTTGSKYLAAAAYVLPYAAAMTFLGYYSIVATYKICLHRFDFIVPGALAAIVEIGAIARFHASLRDVVLIVLAANVLAFAGSLYRVTEGVEPAHGRVVLRIRRNGRYRFKLALGRLKTKRRAAYRAAAAKTS